MQIAEKGSNPKQAPLNNMRIPNLQRETWLVGNQQIQAVMADGQ